MCQGETMVLQARVGKAGGSASFRKSATDSLKGGEDFLKAEVANAADTKHSITCSRTLKLAQRLSRIVSDGFGIYPACRSASVE